MNIKSVAFLSLPLGQVANVRSGYAFKSSNFTESGNPVVRISDISEGSISTTNSVFSQEKIDNSDFILSNGDFAIAMSGATTGKIGRFKGYFAFVNQRVGKFIIRDQKKIDKGYLFYQVTAPYFHEQLNRVLEQGAQPNISSKLLESFNIYLPTDLQEQKAIAKALSDIDELIAQTEKQLIKQKNVLGSLSEKLLNPKRNTEIEFLLHTLGKLGTTFGGLSGKNDKDFGTGSAYVTFLNVMNNLVLDPTKLGYVRIDSNENQNILQENDLVFNGSSETPEEVGFTSVVPKLLEGAYLNSFCFGFRFFKVDEIDPNYFALLSRSLVGRQIIGLLAQGSTRYNISKTELLKLQWPIPSIDNQRKIVKILFDMISLIESTKLAKIKYEHIKQGMMNDLLTGKVRLV